MANAKNTKVPAEDAMAAVSALIAKAKREGSIQATELNAQLEKLDLPVEKIEHIYDTFDAMGIQIVSPELEIGLDDADDGMGIAPEELDQIFELYKQAGQSANRRYRGTGLGLAVVRDLTELHGGTVTVESRVKEGSTFTVRIPYVPVIEEEDEEA